MGVVITGILRGRGARYHQKSPSGDFFSLRASQLVRSEAVRSTLGVWGQKEKHVIYLGPIDIAIELASEWYTSRSRISQYEPIERSNGGEGTDL